MSKSRSKKAQKVPQKDVKILKVKWSPTSNTKAEQIFTPQHAQAVETVVVQAPEVEQVSEIAVSQSAIPQVEQTAPIKADAPTTEQVNQIAQTANAQQSTLLVEQPINAQVAEADNTKPFDDNTQRAQETNVKIAQKPRTKGHRFAMIVGIVLCVVLIPIFVCNIVLTVKSFLDPDEIPSLFGIAPMYVLTGSMEPTINENDLVFVRKAQVSDVAIDDVIAFWDPITTDKVLVAHRVKDIIVDEENNMFFVTQGDHNDSIDSIAVPADNLVGLYIGRVPYMGGVAMFLQTTAGLVLSVSVPLLMLVIFEAIRLLRKNREQSDDTNDGSIAK